MALSEQRKCRKCDREFCVSTASPETLCYRCWSNEPAKDSGADLASIPLDECDGADR